MHLAASDEVHRSLHVHATPVVEDIADAASTVDKAHVTLLTTGSKAEAVQTEGKGGEVMEYSGERRVVRRGGGETGREWWRGVGEYQGGRSRRKMEKKGGRRGHMKAESAINKPSVRTLSGGH